MSDMSRLVATLALGSLLALVAVPTVYLGLPTYSRPSASKPSVVVDAMQQQNTQTRQAVIEVTETDYNKLMTEIGTLRAELRLMKGGRASPGLGA